MTKLIKSRPNLTYNYMCFSIIKKTTIMIKENKNKHSNILSNTKNGLRAWPF